MHKRNVTKFHHYRVIETTRKSHFNKKTTYLLDHLQVFYLEQKHVNEVFKDVGVKVFLVLVNNLAKYILSSVYVSDIFSFFVNLTMFTISGHLSDEVAHLLTLSPHLLPAGDIWDHLGHRVEERWDEILTKERGNLFAFNNF